MTVAVANLVQSTDTFNSWFLKTNELAHAVSNYAITANNTLGTTSGNAQLSGIFSANSLVAIDGIRGGNNTTSNTLLVTSNVNINAAATVANTITINGLGTFSAGINTTSANVSSSINVGNVVTINTTTITIGNSSVNAHMMPTEIQVGNVYMNTTTLVVGATVINSTTLGESSNNANYLDQHSWEEPKEIGGIGPNTAIFTTASIGKISANGSLGTTGEILKANSTGGLFWATGGEGYTGSAGTNGSNGFTGSSGFTGSKGDNGSLGGTGFTGSVGSAGTPGADGYTGSAGGDGTPGSKGFTGSKGDNGSTGFTGSTGVGLLGYTGSSAGGGNGYTGSRGFTGSKGDNGSTGFTGSAFSTGSNAQVNSLGVGTAASGTAGEIRATNDITAFYSDERLKTRLSNISDALHKVMSISGFYFTPNETAQQLGYTYKKEVGVSAQEVQRIMPEVVVPAPISDEYLTVKYDKLIPLLIEAIKELNQKIEDRDAIR